jgi:hypothetical protein
MKASEGFRPRPWAFIISLLRRRLTPPFPNPRMSTWRQSHEQ